MRLALLLLLTACSAPQLRQPTDVTLSLQQIDCLECGNRAIADLEHQPGIAKLDFDRKTAELHVHFDSAVIHPGDMVKRLQQDNLQAVIGAGQGSYVPPTVFPQGSDVLWISHGEAIDLAKAPVPGKVTIVDFGAKWCGPCHELDQDMAKMLENNPNLALRKVDIVDWDSPVAEQQLKNVDGLPYVLVFNRAGQQVAATGGMTAELLQAAVEKAR